MRQVVVPEALREAVAATGFSPAIRAGDFLYLTGATGGLADGTMPETGGDQTRSALSKVFTVLETVAATPAAIVEMTSYHTNLDQDFTEIDSVLHELLGDPLPAWTAIEVAGLRRPGARVEYRIVAYVPQK